MDKQKILDLIKKILVEISRIILGVTFIFSGFVKSVDPWGTAYKIEDYLLAFDLSSLTSFSFIFSAFLCIIEFLLGAFILFGLYRYWTSRAILVVMCFMTPLTLYLAIANPVSDCGCFGDFLIISNWETFYKNIVLIICAIIATKYYEKITNIFTGKTYWMAFLFISAFSLAFVVRNYIYEPIFDFRPYHIGANIVEGMQVEEGKERIEENTFIYAKDGVEQEFTEDNYPWQDSTWVFVKMGTRVIQEGESPKIDNFSLTRLIFNNSKTELRKEEDITEQVLSDSTYTFLAISPSLSKFNENYLSNIEDIEYYAKGSKYKFYVLTASTTDDIIKFIENNSVSFDFCITDDRALKTISRTNPGLILLKNGTIINKWADIEIPAEEDLTAPLDKLDLSTMIDIKEEDRHNLISIALIFFIPLLLLKAFDFAAFRKRKEEQKNIN